MLTERPDTEKKDGSDLADRKGAQVSDLSERELETAIKKGLEAPYAKVLLRLLISVLLVTALGMFITGMMRYDELQRQKAVLEKDRDAIVAEIEELRYLIDCPIDYDYIVRVAREKLGLHLPDEIVYYNDYNDSK